MDYGEIDNRYSNLAESIRCLLCSRTVAYSRVCDGEICVVLVSSLRVMGRIMVSRWTLSGQKQTGK